VCANCTIYGQQCSYEPISEHEKEAGRERHYRVKRRREQEELHDDRASGQRRRETSSIVSASDQGVSSPSKSPNMLRGVKQRTQQSPTQRQQQHQQPEGDDEHHGGDDQGSKIGSSVTASLRDDPRQSNGSEHPDEPLEGQDSAQPWQAPQGNTAEEARVSRILVSANGISSYHGRTSALFEDNVQERPSVKDQHPRMSDEWVERGLVAEALRQREEPLEPSGLR
jgi:hypothetical protein